MNSWNLDKDLDKYWGDDDEDTPKLSARELQELREEYESEIYEIRRQEWLDARWEHADNLRKQAREAA